MSNETITNSPSKELAVIEHEGEVIEPTNDHDSDRVDAEYAHYIRQKTIEFISDYKASIVDSDGNEVATPLDAEKDFENMFVDELMQQLADGSLKGHELSEASVMSEVFAEGWEQNGEPKEVSSDKLRNIAGMVNNLVKAIAVVEHVSPIHEDGTTDDDKDNLQGYKRMSATASSASNYIDGAEKHMDELGEIENIEKIRELFAQIDKRAQDAWPKQNGHMVGAMPSRWV
jgi:hypothetical protein